MNKYMVLTALSVAMGGCATKVQTDPARTATEELLLSTASDQAAAKLALAIPSDATAFVDSSNFDGTDSKYAVAAIRTALLQSGIRLMDDRKKADVIIEMRAGALSTDRDTFLVGIPQFNIPIPLATGSLPFPEIALYAKDEEKGIAKFAVTAYDAKTGELVSAQAPQYGFSHNTKKTAALFISWKNEDYLPQDADTTPGAGQAGADSKPHLEINGDAYAPTTNSATSPTSAPAPAPFGPAVTPSSSLPFKIPALP